MVEGQGKSLTIPNSGLLQRPNQQSLGLFRSRDLGAPCLGGKKKNSRKLYLLGRVGSYAVADEVSRNKRRLLSEDLPFLCVNILVKRLKRQ